MTAGADGPVSAPTPCTDLQRVSPRVRRCYVAVSDIARGRKAVVDQDGSESMAAAQGDPPAVARQRVRRALRKARAGTSWSQGDVARRLGWSLSKMQRIEAGEVGVSSTDLQALLHVYGIDDHGVAERLARDAEMSRRQRYVTAPDYRENLTRGLLELVQFEQGAHSVRVYQPAIYPGVLQTRAVAESILGWSRQSLSEDQIRVRLDVRWARRQRLLEDDDGPEYHVILDESVIRRRIGNMKMTAEQLEDVVEMARLPRVHIRIVPYAVGAYMPALGAFHVFNLTANEEDGILYRETHLRDEVSHSVEDLRFYRAAFDDVWNRSLSEGASCRAMIAEAAHLRSAVDLEEQLAMSRYEKDSEL